MDAALLQARLRRGPNLNPLNDDANIASILVGALERTRAFASEPAPAHAAPVAEAEVSSQAILRSMQANRLSSLLSSPPSPPLRRSFVDSSIYSLSAGIGQHSLLSSSSLAAARGSPQKPPLVASPPSSFLRSTATLTRALSPSRPSTLPGAMAAVAPRVSPPKLPAPPAYQPHNVAADVAAMRGLLRSTPTGRNHNLNVQEKGSIPLLLTQLPLKNQKAARHLSADITALRLREEHIKARLAGAASTNAKLPPPLVLLEVQEELADRSARLLQVAGPALAPMLLSFLSNPAAEAAMRSSLSLTPASPSLSGSGTGGGGSGGGFVGTSRSVTSHDHIQMRYFFLLCWIAACIAVPLCTTADDCERLGECVSGVCHCFPGFTGADCGMLALAPAPAPYVWPEPSVKNTSSWGLNAMFDPADDLFHGLIEVACGSLGILDGTGIFIAHVTSPTAVGDWTVYPQQPIFSGMSTQNPSLIRDKQGNFVVAFRFGGVNPTAYCPGNGSVWPVPPSAPALTPEALTRVATPLQIAWAPTMAGPWTLTNMTVVGDFPGVWHSNPSLWELSRPVGSARWALGYRYNQAPPPSGGGGRAAGDGEERNGVALADDLRGPWRWLANITLGSPPGCQ